MSDKDRQSKAEQIKADYLAGKSNFAEALFYLRQAGYNPFKAQQMVSDFIAEKHNARDN